MHIDLKPYTAAVCGSTQGIGRAVAMQLAEAGARIILIARNADALAETLHALPDPEKKGHVSLLADFHQPEDLRTKLRSFLQNFSAPVHILVNNSGGPASGKLAEAESAALLETFNQHLICNHILATTLLPGMQTEGYGRIINIISTSVKTPLPNLGVSNTIRAAVANWAKTLANEQAVHGITVNNVLPGATGTARLQNIIAANARRKGISEAEAEALMLHEIPANRFGRPEEVAAAVAFLASPLAGYINGVNLPVDGGRTPSL